MAQVLSGRELSIRIEALLKAKGFNDIDIADHFGISKQSVGQWFDKGAVPPARHAQLATLMGLSLDALLAPDMEGAGEAGVKLTNDEEAVLAIYQSLSPSMRSIARKLLLALL